MKSKIEETIEQAIDREYKEAGHNAYFGNGFNRGVNWQKEKNDNELLKFLIELKNRVDSFEYSVNQNSYIQDTIDEFISAKNLKTEK